jgi:hypothetical protein
LPENKKFKISPPGEFTNEKTESLINLSLDYSEINSKMMLDISAVLKEISNSIKI